MKNPKEPPSAHAQRLRRGNYLRIADRTIETIVREHRGATVVSPITETARATRLQVPKMKRPR